MIFVSPTNFVLPLKNVCVTLAKSILNNHPDVEVYFIVDKEWEGKLGKFDERFKFGVIECDNQQENRLEKLLIENEALLKLPLLERTTVSLWTTLTGDQTGLEMDMKAGKGLSTDLLPCEMTPLLLLTLLFFSEKKICHIRPDVLLCDQAFHLPSMHSLDIPFFFIVSANPLAFGFEGFRTIGLGIASNDEATIKKVNDKIEELRLKKFERLAGNFRRRGIELPKGVAIEYPRNPKTASIYAYPQDGKTISLAETLYLLNKTCCFNLLFQFEVDYYNDEIRTKQNLWQIDSPISNDRIPKPFEMPEEFRKLPGKIIFVSLGKAN